MKRIKITSFIILCFITSSLKAQKQEIKTNFFGHILNVHGITYELRASDRYGLQLTSGFSSGNILIEDDGFEDYNYSDFYLVPELKIYLNGSQKQVDRNIYFGLYFKYVNGDETIVIADETLQADLTYKKAFTKFGAGFTIGGKSYIDDNLVIEYFYGIGRFFSVEDSFSDDSKETKGLFKDTEFENRLGILIGWRF